MEEGGWGAVGRMGKITMVAESRVCRACGAPISTERRLVPTSSGAWAVAVVSVGCRNPLCPLASSHGEAPRGPGALVA